MDINAAEKYLIAQVKTTGVKCYAYPKNPAEYRLMDAARAHLIRYAGSTALEPVANRKGVIIQETRHEFSVVTVARELAGHGGIYEHLEILRKAMVGITIPFVPQATAIYHVRSEFLKEENGVWYYESHFAMTCPEAEA